MNTKDLTPRSFTFEHNHRNTSNVLKVDFRLIDVTSLMNIRILSLRGERLGYIGGLWVPEASGITFHAFSSDNFQTPLENNHRPIPRATGASIAEIVLRGYILNWYSSDEQSREGRDMYTRYLVGRPDLRVSSDGDKGYVVRKAII